MIKAHDHTKQFKLLLKQLFTKANAAFPLNDWYNFVS